MKTKDMEAGTKKTIFWAVWQSDKGQRASRKLVEETKCKETFYIWLSKMESDFIKDNPVLLNCGMI